MSVTVRQPGTQTTVQDGGRPMWQHIGVPVGGAMDLRAHRIANMLVGNGDATAAFECAFAGTALQFDAPALIALTGRDVTASIDGRDVPPWRAIRIAAGKLLALHSGTRTTIAIAGGLDVPVVLGGRGTCLRGGFGGWDGRTLRRDDTLPIGDPTPLGARMLHRLTERGRVVADWGAGPGLRPPYAAEPTLRMIPGPQFDELTESARETLLSQPFRIAPDSDRMGCRLGGPTLALSVPRDMLSSGVTAGTIQLPPGGDPIVLMADRQTVGGYPRLGDVISTDLPLLAQLRPGESVRFAITTLDDAHRVLRAREYELTLAAHAIAARFAVHG